MQTHDCKQCRSLKCKGRARQRAGRQASTFSKCGETLRAHSHRGGPERGRAADEVTPRRMVTVLRDWAIRFQAPVKWRRYTDCKERGHGAACAGGLIFSRSPGKPVRGVRTDQRKCWSREPPRGADGAWVLCEGLPPLRNIKCSVGEPAEGSLPNRVERGGPSGPRATHKPPHTTTCKCVGTNARQGPLGAPPVPGGGVGKRSPLLFWGRGWQPPASK